MRAIRSFVPTGLRWRLTAWVAAVLVVSAAVVFVVVYQDTGAQIRGQIDRDVGGDVAQLAQALRPLAGRPPAQIAAAANHYVQTQPFTATSTLLFVLIPGAPPASNHPEVFARGAPEFGETPSEQAQENQAARELRIPRPGYSSTHVPDVGDMRILEHRLDLGTTTVVVGAGEPLALVSSAQHGVARAFLVAGAVVLVLALAASYLAGTRVSLPLRRMAAIATRVNAGDLAPRMELAGDRADEMRVLAESFNHMLDRLAEAFASQRAFIADVSHELRTPLTVIRGQLEVLASQPHPAEDEVRHVERVVHAEIGRISRLVDDLLVLTQAERADFLREREIDLRAFVSELWDGLSLTADRLFELSEVPEGTLVADPDRLAQALRNLGRNAIEHTDEATGLVRLEVEPMPGARIAFAVIDDGPGIPPAQRELVFERFHRVDAGRSRKSGGTGLGLAIVRAIAEAHGGRVTAGGAGDGPGARVELVLPGFTPSPVTLERR
jgi:two-component system, OmpR family, sensor kinase